MSSGNSNDNTANKPSQAEFLRKIDNKIWGTVEGVKRKSNDNNSAGSDSSGEESKETTFYEMGRIFGRIADPYAVVSAVTYAGIRNDTAENDDDDAWLRDFFEDIEAKQNLDTWKIWCTRFAEFRDEMLTISDASGGKRLMKKVHQKIASGINAVRGDDTAGLKGRILKYLPEDISKPLDPPIAAEGNKSDRGWDHPITAALLCPLEWEPMTVILDDIREGRKKVTANQWPRYLYKSGRKYDLNDIETGLFHGYLMFRVAKHIFQGPSAALERPGFHRGKRSNAQIIGITSMSPYTIAYVAVQIRYALSSQTTWSTVDTHFDYRAFFWNIVHCFDDGEGKDIIELYNYHVFGPGKGVDNDEEAPAISDLERMKLERARKRARVGAQSAEQV